MSTKTKEKEEIVQAENTAIASVNEGFTIDAEDIDIPRLNVVQKTSDMDFDVGSLVLDKQHELLPHDTKGDCIVLGATKMWREDIPFDNDEMPRLAYSRAGMESLKIESSYPVIEFAEITLLFPAPKGNTSDAYPFPIGDTNYAMGKLNVQKDAYRKTYKSLATFATFNRGLPLSSRLWHFESQLISRGKYSWYVPTLSVGAEAAPEAVVAFAKTFGA